jgi:hypothetical protein
MTSLAAQFGIAPERSKERDAFLGWQCRCRQMMMRENGGKPTDAVMPAVTLAGQETPLGHIITIMSKSPAYSVTPELTHMAKKTNETAKWREEGLKFFSATFYQKAHEFSDILTSTFPPGSLGAAKLRAAGAATLTFEAYGERWDLMCKIHKLSRRNPLYLATMAHNRLFNPTISPDTEVLGFEPDWTQSRRAN